MFPPRLFLVYLLQLALSFFLARALISKLSISDIKPRLARSLMGLFCILNTCFYFWTTWAMYSNFDLGAVDLATISQSIWNIANGNMPFETIVGTHAFRVHFSLIYYPVALIFKIWPTMSWLLIISSLAVAGTGYAVYLLAKEALRSEWLGLAFGLSFLFNPYLQLAQLAPLHADSFGILFITVSLLALQKKYWIVFGVTGMVALLCKEDVGFLYAGIGLFIWLNMRMPKLGIMTAATGLIYSVIAYTVWMPWFGPDTQHLLMKYFGVLGKSSQEIIRNAVLHPWVLMAQLLHWEKIFSLFYLVAQTGFLVFLSGWALLPLGIAIALRSLTNYVAMYNYWDHYSLHVLPFLYWASVLGAMVFLGHESFARWRRWLFPKGDISKGLALLLIIMAVLVNIERGNNPLSRKFDVHLYLVTEHSAVGKALIEEIPADASVAVQESLAPHLSFRKELYAITPWEKWIKNETPMKAPEYILFDLKQAKELWYGDKMISVAEYYFNDPDYELIINEDGWTLFKKR